jgi:hypothetical protein
MLNRPYRTDRQMDRWTDELPPNQPMWGSLTLAPNIASISIYVLSKYVGICQVHISSIQYRPQDSRMYAVIIMSAMLRNCSKSKYTIETLILCGCISVITFIQANERRYYPRTSKKNYYINLALFRTLSQM